MLRLKGRFSKGAYRCRLCRAGRRSGRDRRGQRIRADYHNRHHDPAGDPRRHVNLRQCPASAKACRRR
jgi:hypothetical protein